VRSLAAGADDRQHGGGIARKLRASRSNRLENRLQYLIEPVLECHVTEATLSVTLL
jgi:hypothetical protein